MLNYFTSFGANSNFEKNRLIVTAKNLDAPEEHILKKILKTFQGEDDETRSQIAFATIVKKISTSDSNTNWIYLLKNLIIFDRVLQEMCFIEEISSLQLPAIQDFIEVNSKYKQQKTPTILKNYWKLIKFNAKILQPKNHILYFPRSQRSQFLNTLTPLDIFQQIQPIQSLFQLSFNLISCISSNNEQSQSIKPLKIELEKSKLIQYLLSQIMYKLISYFSSEMLCVNKIVYYLIKDQQSKLEILELNHVRKFREKLVKFKSNSGRIIEFLENYKSIKGFEIVNYRDLDPMPGNHLLKNIDKYIAQKLNFDENSKNIQYYVHQSGENVRMAIRLKPKISDLSEANHQPRKNIMTKREKKQGNHAFSNWISSFSQDFPQKEIMTLDLIMTLKAENQRNTSYEETIVYRERQTAYTITESGQIPQQLMFTAPQQINLTKQFNNIYSKLEPIWNYD